MSAKEKLLGSLARLVAIVDHMPEDEAAKVRLEARYFYADTISELRGIVSMLDGPHEPVDLQKSDVDAICSACGNVRVTIYHRNLLGGKVMIGERDMSLLEASHASE